MERERAAARGPAQVLKSVFSAGLCAALVVLSPGLECYAASGQIIQTKKTGGAAPTAGDMGQGGAAALPAAAISLSLTPATLSGAIQVSPAAPVVTDGLKAQVGAQAVPLPQVSAAGPISISQEKLASASPLSATLAPAAGSAASTGKFAPAEASKPGAQNVGVPAQTVLEAGARQVSQAQDSSGRKEVLDSLFTGGFAKSGAEAALPQAGPLGSLQRSGLRPAQASVLAAASAIPSPQGALTGALARAKVYVTQAGKAPVAVSLADLGSFLAADPALRDSFNKLGRIRVVLSKSNPGNGLSEADIDEVRRTLTGFGVTAKLAVETIGIDWGHKDKPSPESAGAPSAAQAQAAPQRGKLWRYLLGPITAPFREAAYLGKTFWSAYSNPTWAEVAGGVASKALPSILTVGVWGSMYAGHPLAMALALGISLGLNAFHGVWINTWSNLQNIIGKQRGMRYQTVFNLLYGQVWGAVFRTIAWSVIPKTIPPWSPTYWKDIGISTIVGTFFGTLGYQGLNILYDNGILTRWQRGAIQQVRDLGMCLGGVFLGSGSMPIFWMMFAVQQALDLVIYIISQRVKRRPILYIADEAVAETPEFQGMYPVKPTTVVPDSPLKQAVKMLTESPFVKPLVWLVKKLRDQIKKK